MMIRRKAMLVPAVVCLLAVVLTPALAGTATATGKIQCASTTFVGMNFSVQLTELTTTQAYALYAGSTRILNFTTGAAETSRVIYLTAAEDTPGAGKMTLYLYGAHAGTSVAVDSKTVLINSVEQFFMLDFLINVGMLFIIAGIVVGIVVMIRRQF